MSDELDKNGSGHEDAPRYDDSPRKFLDRSVEDNFSGASGVLFEQAMAQTRMAICLCDPKKPDLPIVFANRAFRELTGYETEEILGRNCRFLQGEATDPEQVAQIRNALKREDVLVVELLNYRKDGTSFWNALHLGPIYNDEGELIYFFGSQWNVSDVRAARTEERHAKTMARELSHRMKNMFAVLSGIVSITGRVRGVQKEANEINERIRALGRAYETTLDDASIGKIELGAAIKAIVDPYSADANRFASTGEELRVSFATISVIGLALHELAANATKYGAWSQDTGKVELSWEASADGQSAIVTWRESGVAGAPTNDQVEDGAGSQIIGRILRAADGSIERDWTEDGLHVKIVVPEGAD